MDTIDPGHFLKFCTDQKGKTLTTITQGAPFKVEVTNGMPEFTPLSPRSKGTPRLHSEWRRVLELFAKTGSYHPSDNTDAKSVNLSYMLAVVRAYVRHLPGCRHPAISNTHFTGEEIRDGDRKIELIEQEDAWDESDEVVQVEVKKPLDKVIPVRLSAEKWEAMRKEARELGIGPSTLARMWILERLRQRTKAKVES